MPMPSLVTTAAFGLSLALAPASAPATGSSAHLEADAPAAVAASLMVEVPTDEPQDVALRTRVFDAAGRAMAAMLVSQRARLDLPGIVVTLRRPPGSPTGTSYAIAIHHTPLGDTPLATMGGVCPNADDACLEQIGADLKILLPRLRDYVAGKATTPPSPPPAAILTPRPVLAVVPPNPASIQAPAARRPLHRLAKAGIGVLAAGVAGLGVGIGLAANPPRLNPEDWSLLITTRPAGYAILGTSLVVISAGTAMLIVGVRRTPRVTPVAQTYGGRSLGLALTGRF